jgi:hypothetical protein
MRSWASEELKYARLPDKRLNRRLIKIVENLAQQPHASIPQASGDWANTKATYNFWQSERVDAEDIIEAQQKPTVQRASKEKIILAIQDTSDFNFTHHRGKNEEQGFGMTCAQKYVKGLKVHSIMASTTKGVPLGVIEQQIWTRPLKTKKKKSRNIFNKESKRWLTGVVQAELAIPSTTKVVTVADREGDIYDLFALSREPNSELLIRAKHNRRVNHELKFVKEAIRQTPNAGQLKVSLPRQDDKKSRTANLTIRYASFDFPPPINRAKSFQHQSESVTLNVVCAIEENPPTGITPIEWLLLTTLEVNNFDEATCRIRWYTYRWLIERYHYVLKSGCRIEQLQLKTADRIKKALATYSIVAWRLLWLTYQARENPLLPCDTILETHEWQSLYCHFHHFSTLEEPPSMKQAVIWIAQLGGFLARRHDGFPGVKTLWRGLQRLHDIASTWKLIHSHQKQDL